MSLVGNGDRRRRRPPDLHVAVHRGPATPARSAAPTGAGIHALTLDLVCTDDAVVTAKLTADDGVNAPVTSDTDDGHGRQRRAERRRDRAVADRAARARTVAISAPFTDPGTNDTHTATIDWGDGHVTSGAVAESAGNGTVTGSHAYATDDTYTVIVTVTDDNGGSGSATSSVISDTTPPVITPNVSPAPNAAGWNNSLATVTLDASTDSVSPIDIDERLRSRPTLSSDTGGTYVHLHGHEPRRDRVEVGHREARRGRAAPGGRRDDGAERERLVQRAGHDPLDVLRRALGHRRQLSRRTRRSAPKARPSPRARRSPTSRAT